MARDFEVAEKYCCINSIEKSWLTSPQAPIVVMECKEGKVLPAELIHPGINTLGVMLPYTPLHYLLFNEGLEILIMTSANISDEPLITDNEEALDKLQKIVNF